MIPNYLYLWFLVFVQALHFYFSVAISNSFNLIFETDLLFTFTFINLLIYCNLSKATYNWGI